MSSSSPSDIAAGAVFWIDESGERLIEANAAARALAGRIADEAGHLHPSLRLPAQLSRLGAIGAQPRLARLRLDRRGLGVPTTCWLVRRARADGADALLISLSDAPPAETPAMPPAAAEAEVTTAPAPAEQPEGAYAASRRLVWHGDASGRIVQAEGGAPGIAEALRDRLWTNFPDGDGVLASIRARRTFRGLKMSLYPAGQEQAVTISVSGSPLSRTDAEAPAWSGFVVQDEAEEATGDPGPTEDSVRIDVETDTGPVETIHSSDPVSVKSSHGHAASAESADRHLSVHEHDAFREIARALGAAASEPDAPDVAIRIGSLGGREPVKPAGSSKPAGPSVSAVLESLPAGVLVHRGREVIFANRRLGDLLHVATIDAADDEGPLGALLDEQNHDGVVSVHGRGETVRLLVERSAIEWDGGHAELLLARTAPAVLHWLGAVTEAGGAFSPIARAQANPAPADGQSITLDPRGRLIMVDVRKTRPKRPAESPPEPPDADSIETPADVEANQASSPDIAIPDVPLGAGGAVVPLLQRVERLLSADAPASDHTAQGANDGATGGRHLEPSAPQPQGANGSDPRRRFDFFKQIGETLRISLSNIGRTAETLLSEPVEPADHGEPLRAIREASIEALGVLDGLLAWTDVATGRGESDPASSNLNAVVAECVAREQRRASGGRIFLRSALTSEAVSLDIDARTLRRAALNAIAHGIDRSIPGSQVIVSTSQAERGEAFLRVRSTGYEMSAEAIARTLEPIFDEAQADIRADGALGLTLAKVLVEESGGRFGIQSRTGEGTLIEIAFPPSRAESA